MCDAKWLKHRRRGESSLSEELLRLCAFLANEDGAQVLRAGGEAKRIVRLFGVPVSIPNVQLPLEGSNGELQDSRDHILSVDGTSVTAGGNNWKYFNLGQTITVTSATMLKFKFSLTEKSEFHFVCLLKPGVGYVRDGRNDCFLLAGLSNDSMKQFIDVRPVQRIEDGEEFEFNINVGSYFNGEVAAIGFGLDNDLEITNERTSGQRYVC